MRVAGVIVVILIAALNACGVFGPQDEQQASLDTVATRVKTELINQAALDAAAVDVQQQDGVIYLRGFADSAAKKQRLETIARQAAGGHKLVNEIQIK